MSNKMTLLGVTNEFKELFKQFTTTAKEANKKTVNNMLEDLVENTPIDTGLAKASWTMTEQDDSILVENTTEYIEYLNDGSSKQAPARFIETTALKYGLPLGTIVEVKQG